MKTAKSHGRKSIAASVRPRDLMAERADVAGVWTAHVVTLFPQVFPGVLGASLTGKALQDGLWALRTVDLRPFGIGRHRNVDDTPAGGGPGMVLRPDVLAAALDEAAQVARSGQDDVPHDGPHDWPHDWPLIALSPRGTPFTQARAEQLSQGRGVTIVCGRFEGSDQRVIDQYGLEEVSIGDFVLSGGEIAAQALIDATVRLIPRVLGNQASVEEESFSSGLLEHPQYTKPVDWNGCPVPDILLSGHHGNIRNWRRAQAERLTKDRRPDLWRAYRAKRGKDPDGDQEL